MSARFAIYYAPAAADPLWQLGSAVIGYDARTGNGLSAPADLPLPPNDWQALTAEPRLYGFHATLKAPFTLAEGTAELGLFGAAEALASSLSRVVLPGWRVALLGEFAALVPVDAVPALQPLADSCVRDLERWRAPLSTVDRERRLAAPLSDRQIAQLHTWGYPYVFEDFRFHMTLTGPLPAALREPVRAALATHFEPHAGPSRIDALSVYRQDERAGRFRLVARFPFGR